MPLRMISMIRIITPQDRKIQDVHNNIKYKQKQLIWKKKKLSGKK